MWFPRTPSVTGFGSLLNMSLSTRIGIYFSRSQSIVQILLVAIGSFKSSCRHKAAWLLIIGHTFSIFYKLDMYVSIGKECRQLCRLF